MEYIFGAYHTDVDEKATEAWYRAAEEWGCACDACRNFLRLAREKHLPGWVHEMLQRLRIPAEKATYVCLLHEQQRQGLYQFSYSVAGRILGSAADSVPGKLAAAGSPTPTVPRTFQRPILIWNSFWNCLATWRTDVLSGLRERHHQAWRESQRILGPLHRT